MPKLILLNGPPRSGKDTAAALLIDMLRSSDRTAVEDKLSAPLKRGFAGIMDVPMIGFNVDGYEGVKDLPIAELGVSFRQFQIDMSEKFMKPLYGPYVFSRLLMLRADDIEDEFIVVSDCGFQLEYNYLKQMADCYLLTIHRTGCNFHGDSRQWVMGDKHRSYLVQNNGTIEEFKVNLRQALYSLGIIGG